MKKTNSTNNKEKDRLADLLVDALGTKASKTLLILKKHRIETPDQFAGAIMPVIPVYTEKEIKQRKFACSLKDLQKIKSDAHSKKKISKTLQISEKEAAEVFVRLKKIKKKYQTYNFNFKFGFGAKPKQNFKKRGTSLITNKCQIKGSEFYVIPNYHRAGNVFDQGNRGTCVANAVVSLLDYKMNNRYSRQQVYHNSKCIDDSIEEEGTYIETPFQLLKFGQYKDYGFVREDECPYNPEKENTTHQGPLPEKVYNTKRIFTKEFLELSQDNIVKEIIRHLRNANPVVIGLEHYESSLSLEVFRTGIYTIPFKGERKIGNHAEVAVGYDLRRRLCLVRNSWGESFASENDKGYVGHAWIPFEYIEKYCFSAVTVEEVSEAHVYVSPEDRLSSVYMNPEIYTSKRAAIKSLRNGKKSSFEKESKLYSRLKLLYKAAILLLLFRVFSTQILDLMGDLLIKAEEYAPFQEVFTKLNGFL